MTPEQIHIQKKFKQLMDLAEHCSGLCNPPATDIVVVFWDSVGGTVQGLRNSNNVEVTATMLESYAKQLRGKLNGRDSNGSDN